MDTLREFDHESSVVLFDVRGSRLVLGSRGGKSETLTTRASCVIEADGSVLIRVVVGLCYRRSRIIVAASLTSKTAAASAPCR